MRGSINDPKRNRFGFRQQNVNQNVFKIFTEASIMVKKAILVFIQQSIPPPFCFSQIESNYNHQFQFLHCLQCYLTLLQLYRVRRCMNYLIKILVVLFFGGCCLC